MKRYRIYFNRKCDLPWSVDEGSMRTEKNYSEVLCYHPITSHTDFSETDRENRPIAWFEVVGVLVEEQKADGSITALIV